MEDLIKSTYKKWIEAKKYAARRCRHTFPNVAKQLDECTMFTGNETLPELVEKIFSPQGREFMLANLFPTLTIFRKFKKYNPEQYKVYIDCGLIQIDNPGSCMLVGNTEANIRCTETVKNNIILMHGAKADVFGYNYAVIHVEKDHKSKCDIYTFNNARVV